MGTWERKLVKVRMAALKLGVGKSFEAWFPPVGALQIPDAAVSLLGLSFPRSSLGFWPPLA